MSDRLKIFSGSANPALTREIAEYLGVPVGETTSNRFSDGEINFQILENVRGADVFVVQPSCPPVNESIMELLIMIDAFRRASANRITAVIPYYGYARQDRKDRPRVPISAKVVASLLTAVVVDRLLTMDLHAGQIQGFFDIPVDHLFAAPVILDFMQSQKLAKPTIVSPDAGGVERARFYAKKLRTKLAIIDKRHHKGSNEVEVMHIIGDVAGKNVVVVDDMIDTAGTVVKAGLALKDSGAKRLWVAASHGVLSGPAISRLKDSVYEKIIITNTIPHSEPSGLPQLVVLSVARLLGEAIKSIHEETSVSRLFI